MANRPRSVVELRKKIAVQSFCGAGRAHFDAKASAEFAGSSEAELQHVLAELYKKPFRESLEIFDINKPFLAAKCQELLNNPKCRPLEKITLMKMLLKTMGEATEEAQQVVNVNTPKALVVVGTSQKRIDAMAAPREHAQLEVSDDNH